MKRITIRDHNKKVMEVVINDKNVVLEVKNGNSVSRINLLTLFEQILKAM
ncbi:MAG: hypothetical protein ACI4RN_01505 [Oscillospiraceae bacterium]